MPVLRCRLCQLCSAVPYSAGPGERDVLCRHYEKGVLGGVLEGPEAFTRSVHSFTNACISPSHFLTGAGVLLQGIGGRRGGGGAE